MALSWFRQRIARNPGQRKPYAGSPRPPARGPRLEALEDRWLLSSGLPPWLSQPAWFQSFSPTPALVVEIVPHDPEILLGIGHTLPFLPASFPSVSLIPDLTGGVQFSHTSQKCGALSSAPAHFSEVWLNRTISTGTCISTVGNWGNGFWSTGILALINSIPSGIVGPQPLDQPKNVATPPAPASPVAPATHIALTIDDSASLDSAKAAIATALQSAYIPGGAIEAGQVIIRVAVGGSGEKTSSNGRVQLNIQIDVLTGSTDVQFNSVVLDEVALTFIAGLGDVAAEHFPPVPVIPPSVGGPPWKPSLPELIPSPQPSGFELKKPAVAQPIAPAPWRGPSANFITETDLIPPAPAINPGSVLGTALTTPPPPDNSSPATDPNADPTMEWFKSRARDLAVLLHTRGTQAGPLDKPDDLDEGAAAGSIGQPAFPMTLPKWLTDDPLPPRWAIGNDQIAEPLLSEVLPRVGRGVMLFQPEALADVPTGDAAAAPTTYFGQLDPAEEAEQEAAASTGRTSPPTKRSTGLPYRLLLVVGCALWSLCWFRHGKFTGAQAPALVGPRREEAMRGPIS